MVIESSIYQSTERVRPYKPDEFITFTFGQSIILWGNKQANKRMTKEVHERD